MFVVVVVVNGVTMSIVDMVDVIAVRDCDVTAAVAVRVIVAGVLGMRGRHRDLLDRPLPGVGVGCGGARPAEHE